METLSRRTILLATLVLIVAPFVIQSTVEASDPYIGQIIIFAGNFAPRNWAYCDGQLVQIQQNPALFSILGTTYGGDGRTTFALPDLRGRAAIGPRQGAGLPNYNLGQRGGLHRVTLSTSQMPSHTHISDTTQFATSTRGNQTGPENHFLANDRREKQYSNATSPNVTMNAACIVVINRTAGGSQSHENMQPYLALNYTIALQGLFPPRN